MPGAPRQDRERGGLFRKNRGLMILLIDIVIIVIVAIIYRAFLYEPPYAGRLEGYQLLLRGFALEDRIMVDLRVEKRPDTQESDGRVYVVFAAGSQEMRLSGNLPKGEKLLSLNGALLTAEEAGEVVAVVSIHGREKRLVRKLEEE
jgi:hypothetical protein